MPDHWWSRLLIFLADGVFHLMHLPLCSFVVLAILASGMAFSLGKTQLAAEWKAFCQAWKLCRSGEAANLKGGASPQGGSKP